MTSATVRRRRPAPLPLELRAPSEFGVFAALAPAMTLFPRGRRRRVLVLPGFVSGDSSTLPLRAHLRSLGHRPVGWRLGLNLGPTKFIFDGIFDRLEREVERAGEPIPVIGWSLGGIYARVMAQERPELVDQVITLGSPFNITLAEETAVDSLYGFLEEHRAFVRDRNSLDVDEIPVPSTSVFSRTDGIVAWQACVQTDGPTAENIEVRGSHCGLGWNAAVAYAIADRLAQKPGDWSRFDPPRACRALYPRLLAH